ncbi:MAG TPA: DUF6361 family protein, partial [Polyangiaceae bacterium]|nr:DUF6361 family protein [Polyangiaceae bacterium]
MRQALALFKETETRDELGLGAIRDALADIMFPGTSTVQTRLRYFLIVPWIYQGLPRSTTSARIGTLVDGAERDLIEVLADEPGAFGALSGRSLQRLPSSVYWNGLMTWGIFRLSLSQWEYHERWDAIRQHNQHVLIPDDGGVAPDLRVAWDPRMPDAPPDWRSSLSMTMQREESVYLRDRMESCGGSLLAHFALTRPRLDVRTPWDAVDRLPARLARMMRNARGFSTLVRGAALLYNLQLCRVSQLDAHRDRIPDYEKSMEQWAAEMAQVEEWSPDELWSFLRESGVPVPIVRGDR